MIHKIIFFCALFFLPFYLNSQSNSSKEDPYKINYLKYNYKYLDSNFKIQISSKDFNYGISKYNFFPDMIKCYKDSLNVIMMIEFNDWTKCRLASFQIGYSWKRLSYHLWLTEDETIRFAHSVGIKHPWAMNNFLIDDSNNLIVISDFFNKLKSKLVLSNKNINLNGLNRSKILDLALLNNPNRIADEQKNKENSQIAAYKKKHGQIDSAKIGIGCDRENCCQKNEPAGSK